MTLQDDIEAIYKLHDSVLKHSEMYGAEFDKMVSIIRQLEANQEWQSIETMPTLPCLVTDGEFVAPYSNGIMPWNEGKSIIFMNKAPTHWMHLPQPPKGV